MDLSHVRVDKAELGEGVHEVDERVHPHRRALVAVVVAVGVGLAEACGRRHEAKRGYYHIWTKLGRGSRRSLQGVCGRQGALPAEAR